MSTMFSHVYLDCKLMQWRNHIQNSTRIQVKSQPSVKNLCFSVHMSWDTCVPAGLSHSLLSNSEMSHSGLTASSHQQIRPSEQLLCEM